MSNFHKTSILFLIWMLKHERNSLEAFPEFQVNVAYIYEIISHSIFVFMLSYQRIMELEERLKSLSQENNQLRHSSGVPAAFQNDMGDSSVEFSRAAIDSDLYSDLISE